MCIIFSGYVIFIIWKIITELQLPNFTDLNYRKLLFFYWFLLIFLPKITVLFTEIYCYFYLFLLKDFTEKYWIFLPKTTLSLPVFTLPKFTVTEQFFLPFTVHYRYRIFWKILYRPTPNPYPFSPIFPSKLRKK